MPSASETQRCAGISLHYKYRVNFSLLYRYRGLSASRKDATCLSAYRDIYSAFLPPAITLCASSNDIGAALPPTVVPRVFLPPVMVPCAILPLHSGRYCAWERRGLQNFWQVTHEQDLLSIIGQITVSEEPPYARTGDISTVGHIPVIDN